LIGKGKSLSTGQANRPAKKKSSIATGEKTKKIRNKRESTIVKRGPNADDVGPLTQGGVPPFVKWGGRAWRSGRKKDDH